MRTDLILALYFFLIAVIALILTPTYLLAVFDLEKKSVIELTGPGINLVIVPISPVPGSTSCAVMLLQLFLL